VLVAARRALDLNLVTRSQFLDFYEDYQRDERRRQTIRREDGGDFYAVQGLRVGRRFGQTVARAAKEGKVVYNEAYRLTGLYGRAFEKYAELLGVN